VGEGADIAVCGHTHMAEADEDYANSGSWVDEVGHYVTVDQDCTLELHEFAEEKKREAA
jgi:UDP-2,3-diacylglucosamine pyrophosphatase LpxH